MKGVLDLRLDLGLRRLVPAWRALISPDHLRADLVAGLTVACVAVPLSLAIALASGVPPITGLITAIVAGLVCALFGGAPLAVSGPTATMAVVLADTVERHGLGALVVVGLACGILQLACGALGLGKLVRLVPVPVVAGITAGVGAIIVIGQLPRVLGLPPPPEAHVIDVLVHIKDLLHRADPASVLCGAGAIVICLGAPKLLPRLPAPLLAVAIPTAVVAILGADVAVIGAIPRAIPDLALPALPPSDAWGSLLSASLLVFALASLESLLSASALDTMASGHRHDPDQEMIGQGLGNVACALAGGLPATGVIARSALNAQAGARTRRAAIVHALALAAAVLLAGPLLARIPIAALAGVLVAVALRMLDPRRLVALARVSRGEAGIFALTFFVMVLTDLVEGVRWGVVAALALAALRLGQTRVELRTSGGPTRFALRGPITFLASLEVDRLRKQIARAEPGSPLVLDLSGATAVDASGAELLAQLVGEMRRRDPEARVVGLAPDLARSALSADANGAVSAALCAPAALSARRRLLLGVDRYEREHLPRYSNLYAKLAQGQAPHTLVFACCDSRILTSLLTCSDPGDLFVVRNLGNMVPPFSGAEPSGASAAVEYAVEVLGVRAVVVCGHSRCGAIGAIIEPGSLPPHLTQLRAFLLETETHRLSARLPSATPRDEVARMNALLQLDHLRSYPCVRDRVNAGSLRLDAWFFDVATGAVEEWSSAEQRWIPLASAAPTEAEPLRASPPPDA
jgi:carbonic anhydrase